jgi:hypothetical protein
MISQIFRSLSLIALVVFPLVVSLAQQPSEASGCSCPPQQPCNCPEPPVCPEAPTCQNLYEKLQQCAPKCSPILCDGERTAARFDVNADCRVSPADAQAVTSYLNASSDWQAQREAIWFDVNRDGAVTPMDVLAVLTEVNAHGCAPTPTPTPSPTATRTPTPAPTNTPTPTFTPLPPQYACSMFVRRRGPGNFSIYGTAGRQDRLYHVNAIDVAIKNAGTGQVVTSGTIWVDPCNRNYGNYPGCRSIEGSTVAAIKYSPGRIPTWTSPEGGTTNLLKAPLHTVLGNGQRTGFTVPQSDFCSIQFGDQVSPLVVDLTGSGVQFTDVSKAPVRFTLGHATGYSAWIANPESVAFVALDSNGNGSIDDVHELFGDRTAIGDKDGFSDGFSALAEYDSDKDGAITDRDAIFKDLLLWNDFDRDGQTDTGELSKATAALKSLSVKADRAVYFEDAAHNQARGKSNVVRVDGSTSAMYDAWFVAGPAIPVGELPAGTKIALPKLGSKEYAQVRQDLSTLLRDDGWKESELNYDAGEVTSVGDSAKGSQYMVFRWKMDQAPECFAQLRYSGSWVLIDQIIACGLAGKHS